MDKCLRPPEKHTHLSVKNSYHHVVKVHVKMWYLWLQIILDHRGDYRTLELVQTLWLFNNRLPMLLALIFGCCIVCVLHSLITGWIPLEDYLFLLFWSIFMFIKIFFPTQPKNLLNLLPTSEVAFKMLLPLRYFITMIQNCEACSQGK